MEAEPAPTPTAPAGHIRPSPGARWPVVATTLAAGAGWLAAGGHAPLVAVAVPAAAVLGTVGRRWRDSRRRDLDEREAQFQLLVSNAGDIFTRSDAQGRFLYVSPAVRNVFGWDPEELVGISMYENVHPEDRPALARARDALRAGGSFTFDLRVRGKDGEYRWVESKSHARYHPQTGEFVGAQAVIRDITERRKAEQALRRSEERYRTVVEALDEGVALVGEDGSILACNPAGEAILGLQPGTVTASAVNLFSVTAEMRDEQGRVVPVYERPVPSAFRTDGMCSGTLEVRTGDGNVHWLEVKATALPASPDEPRRVVASFTDITARRRAEEAVAYQALHDPLTGLPNRALFMDRLAHAITRLSRRSGALAVLFLDLDRFKIINDSLGHGAGDAVLREIAARLQNAVRPQDTVARFGGDEFVVLCEDITGEVEALGIADRLAGVAGDPVATPSRELYVTVSTGVCVTRSGDALADDLLRDADAAMYRAKRQGRARSALFDEAVRTWAVSRLEIEHALRRALDRDELRLHYQPVFDLTSGDVVAAEALVRWAHPERGMLLPGEFIPIAEETGLIVDIGAWVLGEAAAQARRWADEGHAIPVSVNVAVQQVKADLVHTVQRSLRAVRLDPSLLSLEITETALLADGDAALRILRHLDAMGVHVHIDDFGTGYSSLAYLKRLPVRSVKIDRSFVDGLGNGPESEAIVRAVVAMAKALGLATVAEGVERAEQVPALLALGCRHAQGYHLARPMAADRFSAVLSTRHAVPATG